jgi:hypothetical protein
MVGVDRSNNAVATEVAGRLESDGGGHGPADHTGRFGARVPAVAGPALIVVALAAATLEQGGFYLEGRLALAIPIALAALAALTRPARRLGGALVWAAVCATGLGAWAIVRGWRAGTTATGAGVALLLVAMAATVVVARRTDGAGRQLLRDGIVGIALIVAATGWYGTATHQSPWGMMGGSSWRASSTLTYPNAAAALIVLALLFSLSDAAVRRRSTGLAVVTTVLLTALLATQSRGGLLALAVGVSVLAVGAGIGPVVRAVAAPAIGAAIAMAGLVPALAQQAAPRPALAWFGLAAGTAVAVGIAHLRPLPSGTRARTAMTVGAVAMTGIGAWLASTRVAWPADRMTLEASPRVAAAKGALALIARRPLAGVGPARTVIEWPADDGGVFFTPLIHNEYLQTATALGLVGLGLLAAVLTATGVALARSRRRLEAGRWIGPVAGLAALAVHSGFDFLWHLALLPVCAAVLVGLATADDTEPLLLDERTNPT